jgi:hypothetical protein
MCRSWLDFEQNCATVTCSTEQKVDIWFVWPFLYISCSALIKTFRKYKNLNWATKYVSFDAEHYIVWHITEQKTQKLSFVFYFHMKYVLITLGNEYEFHILATELEKS